MKKAPPPPGAAGFSQQVRQAFASGAAAYEGQARLQLSIAWRLGRLCRELPLGPGPRADLGAGSGLLSRSLLHHRPELAADPPLQLDHCPELLERNPLLGAGPGGELPPAAALLHDLEQGLPHSLEGASLLASSFALQWLERPGRELTRWGTCLAPGGWLVVAVPTAGSFPEWRRAARKAGVPCTALALPEAEDLRRAATESGVVLHRCERLRFSRTRQGGLPTLHHLRSLGAAASRGRPLGPGELRRLLRYWPPESTLTWEVLLLLGRKD